MTENMFSHTFDVLDMCTCNIVQILVLGLILKPNVYIIIYHLFPLLSVLYSSILHLFCSICSTTPHFLGRCILVPTQNYMVHYKFHHNPELLEECLCHSKYEMIPMRCYTKLSKTVSSFEILNFK